MPNNSEVDSFLESLNTEPKDDPFKPDVEDVFADKTKTEPAKEEGVKDDEKPLPFNKDPKVQKFIEKEISKRIAEIKPTETETFVRETSNEAEDEISEVLTRIIGNDTPEKLSAIKDFKKVLSGLEEKGAQKALAQLSERAEAEAQEERQSENQLREGFENIENTFDVDLTSDNPKAKKDRVDFIDFITRVAPKNEDGDVTEFPDFEETFKLFKDSRKAEPNTKAKELASRGLQRSTDASAAPVSGDKSWKAVDRLFSKLG